VRAARPHGGHDRHGAVTSMRYVDARLGLAVDLAGRRLAAHVDGGYGEWSASASVADRNIPAEAR